MFKVQEIQLILQKLQDSLGDPSWVLVGLCIWGLAFSLVSIDLLDLLLHLPHLYCLFPLLFSGNFALHTNPPVFLQPLEVTAHLSHLCYF